MHWVGLKWLGRGACPAELAASDRGYARAYPSLISHCVRSRWASGDVAFGVVLLLVLVLVLVLRLNLPVATRSTLAVGSGGVPGGAQTSLCCFQARA